MSDTSAMAASHLSIRPFQTTDRELFRAMNEEWISKYFVLEEQDRLVLGNPEQYILQPGGHIFMAFVGDEAVGCCALVPGGESGRFELAKMTVSASHRGRGIGRRLLEHAILEAKRIGCKTLCLESNTMLQEAIHLYEAFGFVRRRRESLPPSHYQRVNVFMELTLE
jgi:putative acetyltransferase